MGNTVTKLYGGKVILAFDEARHEYKINGNVAPGVTTILKVVNKPALVGWAVKCCAQYLLANLHAGEVDEVQIGLLADRMKRSYRDVMAEAASIGTIVHAFAERYFKGQKPAVPKNKAALNGVEAFLAWTKEHEVKPVEVEFRVCSLAHGYCGSGDLDAHVDEQRCVIDYKTSSGIWPEYFLQDEAYMIAREEELGIKYAGGRVVRFDKTSGEFEVSELQARGKFEAGFLGALALHRALEEANKGKRRWREAPVRIAAGSTWLASAAERLLENLGAAAEELYEWQCREEGFA